MWAKIFTTVYFLENLHIYIYVIECKYKKCLLLLSTVQSKEKQTPNFVIALNKLSNIPLLQLPKKNLNNYLYF